jgi:1-phosphofructokinase
VAHLFTLTGNLLAERTLEFEAWSPGRTQRASRESFQVGGKGINVSKMLNRLGAPNTALCFIGGAPGMECESWLRARGFGFKAFATATPTRTGVVVRARGETGKVPPAETTFLGPDAPPDAAGIRACAEFLDAQPDGQVLAICGSLPGWSHANFDPLRATLERWLGRGSLVVDTYGPPLGWFAELPVTLIKINADELRALAPDLSQLPAAARATRWIVTDGAAPIRIRDTDGVLRVVTPPLVREVSPTGSGDVLLACVLEALFRRGNTLLEAVTFALPYAAANAAHPGIAEFPADFT